MKKLFEKIFHRYANENLLCGDVSLNLKTIYKIATFSSYVNEIVPITDDRIKEIFFTTISPGFIYRDDDTIECCVKMVNDFIFENNVSDTSTLA